MKKLIIVTMIVACVALCAAVWPHGNAVEETPVPAAETAVSAKEATVAEIEEPATLAEKEKRTIPQQEAPQEEQPEPKTGPIETPVASELQLSTGQVPAKNSAPEPTPPQPSKELHPGDKVYVAGFGWVEYEGPGNVKKCAVGKYPKSEKHGNTAQFSEVERSGTQENCGGIGSGCRLRLHPLPVLRRRQSQRVARIDPNAVVVDKNIAENDRFDLFSR